MPARRRVSSSSELISGAGQTYLDYRGADTREMSREIDETERSMM